MGKHIIKTVGMTDHCAERAKERIGIKKKKKTERLVHLALERGVTAETCKRSADRKFLEDRSRNNTQAIAFNGCCYIMDKETLSCVTIYKLPNWFGKSNPWQKNPKGYRMKKMELKMSA